jgi:hypothetical protein
MDPLGGGSFSHRRNQRPRSCEYRYWEYSVGLRRWSGYADCGSFQPAQDCTFQLDHGSSQTAIQIRPFFTHQWNGAARCWNYAASNTAFFGMVEWALLFRWSRTALRHDLLFPRKPVRTVLASHTTGLRFRGKITIQPDCAWVFGGPREGFGCRVQKHSAVCPAFDIIVVVVVVVVVYSIPPNWTWRTNIRTPTKLGYW